MRCFVVVYGAGAMLVVSSYQSSTNPALVSRLKSSDISKIMLMEVPVDLVRQRYGDAFELVARLLGKDDFRIVDFNGGSVFNHFKFSEMGQPIMVEF